VRGAGRVGPVAQALGFAGLLPQVAAVALMLLGRRDPTDLAWLTVVTGYALAIGYGGLILSFLGGIWWGHAMRREERQASLAAIAIMPSLVALVTAVFALGNLPGVPSPWPAIVLGSAIMLTLIVDQRLVTTGEAPEGWMRLRAPLSLGLGALTIAAGVLLAG
jgi:peptidoglycan/LPS O-acetylase OafA/YrhL